MDGFCPKCGKPKVYVGDYFGGPKPWCECDTLPIRLIL